MSLRLFKMKKKVKKIFSGMVCCTGWTEYIFLVWHIVALAETKVFSHYPKWKVSQDENNIFFFHTKRVPVQLATCFHVYLSCFPRPENKTLYSSTMFLLTAH